MTTEEAMRKVTGVILHPVFERARPDIIIEPASDFPLCHPGVRVSGPRGHLDGISRALERVGMQTYRPAPAILLIAVGD